MRALFFGGDGLIRSGWRAAAFIFSFFLAAPILWISEEIVISSLPIDAGPAAFLFRLANGAGLTVLAISLGILFGKLFENLPARSLGASPSGRWFKNLILGGAVGAVTLSVAVLLTFMSGGQRFELNLGRDGGSVLMSLLVSFVIFAFAAAWEEAFFRGYLLQTFVRSGRAWIAVLLISAFFGFIHAANPNATAVSTLNTILAGLWFSLAYFKTRDLWFVWGIHLMWNWMQGSFFGIEVSGVTEVSSAPFLTEIDLGPDWLTGKDYGLEGGLACTLAIIASMIFIYFLPELETREKSITPETMRSGS